MRAAARQVRRGKGLCLLLLMTVMASSAQARPAALTVVMDDNYPPYVFRDSAGHVQGILKDRWTLWEAKTGIPVNILATDWGKAQEIMKAGGADVIDTMFLTEARKKIYDFSAAYAEIEVPIFFHKSIGGINTASSLHGFPVGVKEGDSCIDTLHAKGIDDVVPYPSYEAMINAAAQGTNLIFCMDKPPATYLLYKAGLGADFRYTAPLYAGAFHWAVRTGNYALQQVIADGYAAMTPEELKTIDDKWLGLSMQPPHSRYLVIAAYVVLGAAALALGSSALSLALRRQVRARTGDLSQALAALGESQAKTQSTLDHLDATLDAIPDLLFEMDEDGRYLEYRASRPELLLMPPEAFIGRRQEDIMPPDAAAVGRELLNDAAQHGASYGWQICLPLPDGKRWFELSAARMRVAAGEKARFIVLSRDITERKEAEAEVERLAYFDPLTHLPNRRLLMDRLRVAMAVCQRHHRHGALLFIDLDDFKTLNDTRGHKVGDLLLAEMAQRLQGCVRTEDCVSRLGGDEFLIMLDDLSGDAVEAATQAEIVGEKILGRLRSPYLLEGREYHFSASIGICLFAGDIESEDELLKRADAAMYRAKTAGRNTLRFFDPALQAGLEARAALESDLRRALPEQQLVLYYQAQVDGGGQVVAAEALLRWQHPQRGLVSPLQFITLAEETGLIVPVGAWVLEAACAQLKQWETNPRTAGLQLSVNVSARQFRQADFVQQVGSILRSAGIDPARLKLEMTESLVLDNVADTIEKMHALKALGVRFSMDDFGTGHSSLSYLKRLPLDELKIDQSFVRDIVTDPSDAVIVQTIIGMARNLGLEVIAEGVETESQRDFLARHGCGRCQGYLFSRPLPLAEFETLLN